MRGRSQRWADEANATRGALGRVGLMFGYYRYFPQRRNYMQPVFVGELLGEVALTTEWAPLRVSIPAAERPCEVLPSEAYQGLYGEMDGAWAHHFALVLGGSAGSVWLDDVSVVAEV